MKTKTTNKNSYLNATGPIPYGMTNDYMFRLILEKNNYPELFTGQYLN